MRTRSIALTLALAGLLSMPAIAGAAVAQEKPKEPTVELTTKPKPPTTGTNEFAVTLTGIDGQPIVGVDVSVTLIMPAMPSMNMAEMKNTISLKPLSDKRTDAGKYTGKGPIMMAGTWNVVVTAKQKDKTVVEKTLTLVAK